MPVSDPLLLGGVLVACFVAYNVGGATTGPAFGPAVGAGVVAKTTAAGLMAICFFAGAWTVGRRVVDTLGRDLIHDPSLFSLPFSIVVLFFVGGALLIGNVSGAPSSTSGQYPRRKTAHGRCAAVRRYGRSWATSRSLGRQTLSAGW